MVLVVGVPLVFGLWFLWLCDCGFLGFCLCDIGLGVTMEKLTRANRIAVSTRLFVVARHGA